MPEITVDREQDGPEAMERLRAIPGARVERMEFTDAAGRRWSLGRQPRVVECRGMEDWSNECPYCTGEACAQCVNPTPAKPCDHDVEERHRLR
jgi:hypothetical protein